MKKHIAVDLDGTLAHYDGWKGVDHIGPVITPMKLKVLDWIQQGHKVEIYTARVSVPREEADARYHIDKWLRENGLPDLEITCIKKKEFQEFYDDRAFRVIHNTGIVLNCAMEDDHE